MKKIVGLKWNKDTFLILILAGILLFIVILPTESDGKSKNENDLNINVENIENLPKESQKEVAIDGKLAYEEAMEKKLGETIQYIEGVGLAKVIITLESTAEEVIEKDVNIDQSGINEQDAQGGERSEDYFKNAENTIYGTSSEGIQEPYVVKTIFPVVEGIVVICQGGGSNTVAKNLTDLIQALFGIDAHKIKIVKMKS